MYSHFTFVFFGFFTNGHQTRFGVNEDFLKIYESIMYFSIGPAFIHQVCHLKFFVMLQYYFPCIITSKLCLEELMENDVLN